MVSDVVGFSAWSSVREPVHVFKLLETLYETFDQVAEKHKVFKVRIAKVHGIEEGRRANIIFLRSICVYLSANDSFNFWPLLGGDRPRLLCLCDWDSSTATGSC